MAADEQWSERTLGKAEHLISVAHELFANRVTATSGAFARDRHGHRLPPGRVNDSRAVRWSPTGALLHAAYVAFGVETEVIHAPPGSGMDLTGPKYVLAAIDLVEAAMVDLLRSTLPTSPDPTPAPADTWLSRLFEESTPPARRFLIAELISGLPELSHRQLADALVEAALLAQGQIAELRRARRQGRRAK